MSFVVCAFVIVFGHPTLNSRYWGPLRVIYLFSSQRRLCNFIAINFLLLIQLILLVLQNPFYRFYFRIASNWDYGWQQKQCRLKPRDVNHGRCAILRDTFYRKNNLAPDPPHYSSPTGGEFSICSEYSCNAN